MWIIVHNRGISKISICLKDNIKINQIYYRKPKFTVKSKLKGESLCSKTEKLKA